jgi:carboxyl-terminal processing protease
VIRRRIVLGVVLVALFGVGWGVGRVRAGGDLYRNLDLFVEVLRAVQTGYVDPVEPRQLVEGGLHGMLRSLDPYSDYLTPREVEAQRGTLEEEFSGLGVYLDEHQGVPLVVAPIEGSPAWEAGLLPGDLVTQVDGHSTFGLGLPEVADRFKGDPGTSLAVTIVRPGEPGDRTLTITRRRVETRSVPYAFVARPGIGYVRLARFGEHAAEEFAAAIDTLRAAGARALVVDVRDDPGGLVDQAVSMAAPLVGEGALVVTTRGRAVTEKKWAAPRPRARFEGPVAVLVDGGTASAAEILAGALQDHDRALLVGQATYGKGSVQDFLPLGNRQGALRLTTAWYYTPSGRSIQRGVAGADLDEEDDGSDDEGAPPADSAAADSGASPATFHTAAGRAVRAGGVQPDVEVKPDSLGPVAREVADRRLALSFAAGWVPEHGGTADAAARTAFRTAAEAAGLNISDASWAADAPALDLALRRELARRTGGAAAAARVSLEADPVFRRAAGVLERARAPRDVFSLVEDRAPAAGRGPVTGVRPKGGKPASRRSS